MKHILLSSTAALALCGTSFAQDNPIQAAVEAGIAALNEDGANISYDSVETGSGNAVTFRGVRMSPDDGEAVITTDFITLAPNAGTPGEVTITMADLATLVFTPPDGSGDVTVEMVSEDLEITTNWLLGAAGKPSVSFAATSIAMTGGDPAHPVLKNLDVAMDAVSMNGAFDESERNADFDFSMGTLAFDYTAVMPDTEAPVESRILADDYRVTFTATKLPDEDGGFEQFMSEGGTFKLTASGGGSSSYLKSEDPEMPLSMDGSGGPGSILVSYDPSGIVYDVQFGEIDYEITPDPTMLPLPPFSVTSSGGLMEMRAPVAPTGNVEQMKVALALRDLVISDSVWGMLDPEAKIPRDPATLEIDVTADVLLNMPLAAAPMVDNPMELGEVQKVDINRMFLTAGGATIEAGGGVTLDNSGFFPMPSGAVDINVAGLQTLASTLVDLGLLEQMQVGMAMGMMMAFAEAGTEPDTFSSKIEFKDGGIFANGQPIQ